MADLGTLTTLARIDGEAIGPLVIDADGDLIGVANDSGPGNDGTVFEIAKTDGGYASTPTTLGSFSGANGANPNGGVAVDSSGDLYGVTSAGPSGGANGAIYEMKADAQSATGYDAPVALASFSGTNGSAPNGVVLLDSAGDAFGVTASGGTSNDGTVFELANGASTPATLVSFDGTDGETPVGGLVADAAGDLYGVTETGGPNGYGEIFEIAKTADGYATTPTILAAFQPPPSGPMAGPPGPENPVGPLTIDANGNLFGSTSSGGAADDGTIFEYNGATGAVTTLASFDGQDGAQPEGGLIEDAAGNLFGVTAADGAFSQGEVFELQNTAQGYHLVDIYDMPSSSSPPSGGLVADTTGDLFGLTAGTNGDDAYELTVPTTDTTRFLNVALVGVPSPETMTDHETIKPFATESINDINPNQTESLTLTFAHTQGTLSDLGHGSYDAATGVYTDSGTPQSVTADLQGLVFTPTQDAVPPGDGFTVGFTVTTTDSDGATSTNNATTVLVTASPAVETTLASFDGTDGNGPAGVTLDGAGNLFGASETGGAGGVGTIFEIAKIGDGYASTPTTLASFDPGDGTAPNGGFVIDGAGDIIGTAAAGGADNDGTIFELANTGSGYASSPTILANFDGTDGQGPRGDLIADGNGDIFGTTFQGGANGAGTVFELAHTASGYAGAPTDLASFNADTTGSQPNGGLVMDANGDLFGTTSNGGSSQEGTIFEIAKTASGYGPVTTLYDFTGANQIGYHPYSPLVIDSAGNLYGTTETGGSGSEGTVFELTNSAGSYAATPTVLANFDGEGPGGNPGGVIEIDAEGNIFGTTTSGDADGEGGLFELAKDSSGYGANLTNLYAFDNQDSQLSPAVDAAGDLFGTSLGGGANNDGTVFEIANSGYTPSLSEQGETLTANDTAGQHLTGTPYNDTFYAEQNSVVMTGDGGADTFVFNALPWNAGQITDFNTATDVLDLSGIFASIGYDGNNPVADGYLTFQSDGQGDTQVYVDTHQSSDPYPTLITTLDGVDPSTITASDYIYRSSGSGGSGGGGQTVDDSQPNYTVPDGVTNVVLTGSAAQTVTANNEGDTITSNDYGSTIIGGTGNDTLIAGHGADQFTGNGGDDSFVYNYLPWNAGQITDFNTATDTLNLNGIFNSIGYTGDNPVGDGYLTFQSDGNGNTLVYVDSHQSSDPWPTLITTLDGVAPSSITPADYGYGSNAGGGSSGGGSGGGGQTVDDSQPNYTVPDGVTNVVLTGSAAQTVTANNEGDTVTSNDYGSTIIGGTGNDTLIAGHGADQLTGNGGDDSFVFNYLPWNAGSISDFNTATDTLNLSGIMQSIGYSGSNPQADGYVNFVDDGQGDTKVYVNPQGPSTQIPILVTTLEHVSASALHQSGDYIYA